jgi:hypothetical protein
MAGATGYRYTFSRHQDGLSTHDTSPLFERMGNDEIAELQVFLLTFSLLSSCFSRNLSHE